MTVPELTELIALRGPAQGLALAPRRRARELMSGAHASAHRGRGLEFQEVRQYVAGDDPRTIDWRVTARRGRPHTKLFREERERPVWLLVDLNASLFFGSRRQLKSAAVVRAAALLAWVAALGGDRIGAVITGAQGRRVLPARSRDAGVLPLLAALCELQPRAPGGAAAHALTDALDALAPLARSGSIIFAVSDFAGVGTAGDEGWSALAGRAECRLFWVVDPLEEQGLPNGLFRAGVPGRVRLLEGARVRAHWLASWRQRAERVRALAGFLGASLTRLDTSHPVEETLGRELGPGAARGTEARRWVTA
ncbi:MAG: DUF58 domain-containing protein [Steroidobacteraceae bacterium]